MSTVSKAVQVLQERFPNRVNATKLQQVLEQFTSPQGFMNQGVEVKMAVGGTYIKYPAFRINYEWAAKEAFNFKIDSISSTGKTFDMTSFSYNTTRTDGAEEIGTTKWNWKGVKVDRLLTFLEDNNLI